jgi:ribosomal protein S18 acetylase RimI-like enzyme
VSRLEFRVATDAVSVHERLARCGVAMRERYGVLTWDPPKPLRLLEPHVRARETWEALEDGRVVASLTLSAAAPAFYDLSYFDAREPARYLSSLAVEPREQQRGLGRACVEWALAAAGAAGARSVRLDTAGDNEPAQAFFDALGFVRRSPAVGPAGFTVVYFERST